MIAKSVERCLLAKVWHAFHALAKGETTLERPKALVFTQSLVSALHLSQSVVQDFQARFDSGEVPFAEFQRLISAHVLEKVKAEDEMDMTMLEESDDEDTERPHSRTSSCVDVFSGYEPRLVLDDLCWTLFSKQGLPKGLDTRLSLEALHHMWQWFVTFADTDEDGVVLCPVLMNGEELNFWLHYLINDLLALKLSPQDPKDARVDFEGAVEAVLAAAEDLQLSRSELESALKEFHEEVVCSLLRKGTLLKKSLVRNTSAGFADIPAFLFRGTSDKGYLKEGRRNRTWKQRHCVLMMSGLTIFSHRGVRVRRANIPVSKMTAAEPHREEDDMTYFQVETEGAMFVFKAEDLRNRNQWIRDVRFAIDSNQQEIDNVHFLRAELRKEEFARRREERAQRQQIEQRNEDLARANEELHNQVRTLQNRVAGVEAMKEQESDRLLRTQTLEAKLHSVTESTKETMTRLQQEIVEKSQDLDTAQRKVLQFEEELRQLRENAREERQKLTAQLARNQELDARNKELLDKMRKLEQRNRASAHPWLISSHRGPGAFPKETSPNSLEAPPSSPQ